MWIPRLPEIIWNARGPSGHGTERRNSESRAFFDRRGPAFEEKRPKRREEWHDRLAEALPWEKSAVARTRLALRTDRHRRADAVRRPDRGVGRLVGLLDLHSGRDVGLDLGLDCAQPGRCFRVRSAPRCRRSYFCRFRFGRQRGGGLLRHHDFRLRQIEPRFDRADRAARCRFFIEHAYGPDAADLTLQYIGQTTLDPGTFLGLMTLTAPDALPDSNPPVELAFEESFLDASGTVLRDTGVISSAVSVPELGSLALSLAFLLAIFVWALAGCQAGKGSSGRRIHSSPGPREIMSGRAFQA